MLPKHRTSKSRKNKRRSHHFLTPRGTVLCDHCNQVALPHRVCPNCGWFRGREVVKAKES